MCKVTAQTATTHNTRQNLTGLTGRLRVRNKGDVDERWMGSTAASGPEVDGGLARRRCMPQTGSRLAADWQQTGGWLGAVGLRAAAGAAVVCWSVAGLLVCWSRRVVAPYKVFLTSTCAPLACGCAERLESVPHSHQLASRSMYHATVCLRPSLKLISGFQPSASSLLKLR